MEEECTRQRFCEYFSQVLLQCLCNHFSISRTFNKTLLQTVKPNGKKKKGDFVIPKSLIAHVSDFCDPKVTIKFADVFEKYLKLIVDESQVWRIPISCWWKVDSNYVFEVRKSAAMRRVIIDVLGMSGGKMENDRQELGETICCHVNDEPTVNDIRTLLLCSFVSNAKGFNTRPIILSSEQNCDRSKYSTLVSDLNLSLNLEQFEVCQGGLDDTATSEGGHHSIHDLKDEIGFLEACNDEQFIRLRRLRLHHFYKTAFSSRILCHIKNCRYIEQKAKLSQERTGCLHLCSQKKQILAQQAELYYAWKEDKMRQSLVDVDVSNSGYNHDLYAIHYGVNCEISATSYLKLRSHQIKDSFEAKHRVQATGEHWEKVIKQMRTALMKLEYYGLASSNKLKLDTNSEFLPIDATFILYNFSRLCTLLATYSTKVKEGVYPPLPPIQDTDISVLVEDIEWELIFNNLWIFKDVITKPRLKMDKFVLKINTHHLVNYLQQLCRCLSAFYSRHHILGENLPHLLPVMHARIYLVKAVVKVMEEVFIILQIEPLRQM